MNQPQMIEVISQSVDYSIFDVKWIPFSEKFITMGSRPKGTGILQIFELNNSKLRVVKEIEKKAAFKCGSFGASSLTNRHLAIADFSGRLQVLDLERPIIPVYSVSAHKSIINSIDAIGERQINCATPEIVTGSRDGSVKVWDIREGRTPVIDMTPEPSSDGSGPTQSRDCWAVAFGDAYYYGERSVAAGYDNGDLKLFDLRTLSVQWEKTERNGIVSIEFDRKDIPMNKMVVTTLNGGVTVYDMRTQHEELGFVSVLDRDVDGSTVWTVKHLPQNRDVFVTCGGTGSIRLCEYEYPDNRCNLAPDGYCMGVAGNIRMLCSKTVSSQPVHCFDWNPNYVGLGLCGSFDRTVRVLKIPEMKEY